LEKSEAERKRAEKALLESEERYRQIVETSLEGIWVIDEEFRTAFVNRRIADMLGYAPEEILGKRVDSFIFEEDLEDYASRIAARRRGVGEVFERRFRRKDGTALWNIVSSSPLINGEGRFTGSFSMVTDISARKQAEKSILESRALLNSIIEGTTDAIYAKDLQGKYILCNAAAGRAVGKRSVDVLGKDDSTLFPSSEAQSVMEGDRKVIEGKTVITYEAVLTIATGQKVTYLSTKGPLFDASGKPIGLFGLTRDITERKKAERRLQESEKEAKRLAQESELIAEIGRIISSTLNVEEIYEHFANKVKELIPFDVITVNTVNMKDHTRTITYINGDRFPGNRVGEVHTLAGTRTEQVVRTKSSLLTNSKNREDVIRKLPGMLSRRSGSQTTMLIPLISKDEV
jgi:PAS domain S-box-containing protein